MSTILRLRWRSVSTNSANVQHAKMGRNVLPGNVGEGNVCMVHMPL